MIGAYFSATSKISSNTSLMNPPYFAMTLTIIELLLVITLLPETLKHNNVTEKKILKKLKIVFFFRKKKVRKIQAFYYPRTIIFHQNQYLIFFLFKNYLNKHH